MASPPMRRRRRLLAAGIAAAAGASFGAALLAQPAEKTIRVLAKKFEFIPSDISLALGEPVVLELTAEDVTMGFYAADFKVDVEIVPGSTTRVRLVPDKAGTFGFICDVFCGEGHEDMGGTIRVV